MSLREAGVDHAENLKDAAAADTEIKVSLHAALSANHRFLAEPPVPSSVF